MYAEKPKTALWYANHRTNVFGKCESIPEIKLTDTLFVLAKAEIIGIRNILYAQTKQFKITRWLRKQLKASNVEWGQNITKNAF